MTHVEHGFGPVWDDRSQVLVLGSMPSPKSREMRFYYGHKRNRFWPVMAAVFHDDTCLCEGMDAESTVAERRDFALRHHMALWDVIASCDIAGASDASIRNVVANDLAPLIGASHIDHIFTTGAKAAQLYRRLCAPALARSGCRAACHDPASVYESGQRRHETVRSDRCLYGRGTGRRWVFGRLTGGRGCCVTSCP